MYAILAGTPIAGDLEARERNKQDRETSGDRRYEIRDALEYAT
jgi:hypothetical protein